MREEILFTYRTFFWPIAIWPYYEKSHTIQIIGWQNKRPHTIKNVKMSYAGTLIFTDNHMKVSHLLLGRWLSITINNNEIESVHPYDRDKDLLEVIFHKADMSRMMKFFLKGAPDKRILLNLQGIHLTLLKKAIEGTTT